MFLVLRPSLEQELRREIEATDGEIDRLVYELYGLTEEPPKSRGWEIKIVDGG